MENDTPFHLWMNRAVDEMRDALNVESEAKRVHLFRCFNAIIKAMEEVIKAHSGLELNDHAPS